MIWQFWPHLSYFKSNYNGVKSKGSLLRWYNLNSYQAPERWPLERRTLVPKLNLSLILHSPRLYIHIYMFPSSVWTIVQPVQILLLILTDRKQLLCLMQEMYHVLLAPVCLVKNVNTHFLPVLLLTFTNPNHIEKLSIFIKHFKVSTLFQFIIWTYKCWKLLY